MMKKILLAATLLIGLTATSAFAATPTKTTTTKTATSSTMSSQLSPITYVKSVLNVGQTQDYLTLTWKYVDLAYGYNVYIDGVKQPGNPAIDPNVSVVDDGISYYQQWLGYVSKGTTHTIQVTTVYPTGVETQPYTFTITAP